MFPVQLEVLHLLTPKQTAELLLVDLPVPLEKNVVIDRVFDFLLESPEDLQEVLPYLVEQAERVKAWIDVMSAFVEVLSG